MVDKTNNMPQSVFMKSSFVDIDILQWLCKEAAILFSSSCNKNSEVLIYSISLKFLYVKTEQPHFVD